jgi:hypothetical protein
MLVYRIFVSMALPSLIILFACSARSSLFWRVVWFHGRVQQDRPHISPSYVYHLQNIKCGLLSMIYLLRIQGKHHPTFCAGTTIQLLSSSLMIARFRKFFVNFAATWIEEAATVDNERRQLESYVDESLVK